MKQPKPPTVDFETHGIEGRPKYPPIPVGVSIKYWGKKSKYYAFGHIDGNNCSFGKAVKEVKKAFSHPDGVIFQNAKFDVDVADVHMGVPIPDWDKIHDTMFLLYLDDPHQMKLGLKESAERLLDWNPEERDASEEWLIKNQPILDVKVSKSKSSPHYAGRYLAYVPVKILGPYAMGDTDRTEALFKLLWKKTKDREMLEAYDRERRLMPILLEMERQGLPVNLTQLRKDVQMYEGWREKIDTWVYRRLKSEPFKINSGDQLMKAMIAAGAVNEDEAPLTATGKFQTNKEALLVAVTDKVLLAVLTYRSQLNTCMNTFMIPWLITAERSKGLIFTTWNQTKNPKGAGSVGTRTGRLSSNPNFQNIPNAFKALFHHQDKKKKLPKCPWKDLPSLPKIRGYVVPFKGEVFIDRDYCFSPDTEILTNKGFVLFTHLDKSMDVAQWCNGEITYAKPKEYQKNWFSGDLINIVGERSTDLLVTPNHECLIIKEDKQIAYRADEYPVKKHGQQLHAGIVTSGITINPDVIKLVVAIQADAANRGTSIRFYLKKPRKIEALTKLLTSLGVPYTRNTSIPSKPEVYSFSITINDLPDEVSQLISLEKGVKIFKSTLLALSAASRLIFLKELGYWDGSIKTPDQNWVYTSTNLDNTNLVQELATITNLRSIVKKSKTTTGKPFECVSLRTNSLTHVKTFTKTLVPYVGNTYCVTMPQGTVIVRRNGKVCITLQSQQEPRILAHFDGGALLEKYLEDPWIDMHDYAKEELAKMGKYYERKPVKNTNLGLIYGMGAPLLAVRNDMSVKEADTLKKAVKALYPGLAEMYKDMKQRMIANLPIRTWGGREYYCEPAKVINGRLRTFDYKMVNVLIQGSAADCTKEAIIRFHSKKQPDWKIVINVHDQITASVPRKDFRQAMEILRVCMEEIEFDVAMLTEGTYSHVDWDNLQDYDIKGELVV